MPAKPPPEVVERLRLVPRLSIVLPAVYSATPVLAAFLLANVGVLSPGDMLYVFTMLYLASLPLTGYGVYMLYRLASGLSCASSRFTPLLGVLAMLPLGYILALVQVGRMVSECKLVGTERLSQPMVDVVLNVITLGLHSIFYAMLLERIIDANIGARPMEKE